MKKVRCRKILGVFTFIFILLLGSVTVVDAVTVTTVMTECPSLEEVDWEERYDLDLSYDGDNTYTLTMGNNLDSALSNLKKKKKIKFKVDSIVTYTSNDNGDDISLHIFDGDNIEKFITSKNKTLTPGSSITFKRVATLSDGTSANLAEGDGVEIGLIPKGFKDPIVKEKCKKDKKDKVKDETFRIEVDIESSGTASYEEIDDGIDDSDPVVSSASVDCSKVTIPDTIDDFDALTIDQKFCVAKKNAPASRQFSVKSKDEGISISNPLKCDWKKIVTGIPTNDKDYYVNRDYFYASSEYEKKVGTYKYNYERGSQSEEVSCKLKCEEALTVEYGPPVASTAGLCFEYKVKVTSVVNCSIKDKPKKPKKQKVCTPVPICTHSTGKGRITAYKQGGPNEEFDSCITDCDNGKYTDKCVSKCYKKVYGSDINKQESSLDIYYSDKLDSMAAASVEKVADSDTYMYKVRSDGSIYWYNGKDNTGKDYRALRKDCGTGYNANCVTDSTWHRSHKWGIAGHNYACYDTRKNGIPRMCSCKDKCSWQGCKGEVYLNKSTLNKDKDSNKDTYETAKNKCKAAASCTTTTAEFTMSVTYEKSSSATPITIKFPYSSSEPDKIQSHGKDENIDTTTVATNTASNSGSTILKYAGCYKSEDQKKWYQTEWSFPGTWINNKTLDISYKDRSGDAGWKSYPNKFCIPLNAKDVNQSWWIYYYAKKYSNSGNYSYNDKNYLSNTDKCLKTDTTTSTLGTCDYGDAANGNGVSDINYNINAETSKFGYFGWNIKVDCFYALNREFSCTKKVTKTNKVEQLPGCEDVPTEKYRVRTVDLKNLFPSPTGAKLENTASTGRSPGFNWSKYATQETKDASYISQPSEYTKWVQEKGYSVYSNDYLDYEVDLTKDVIRQLKDSNRNYAAYKGSVDTNSVSNYKSPLFRNNGVLSGGKNAYPNGQALKCNNIGTHSPSAGYSAQCESFR